MADVVERWIPQIGTGRPGIRKDFIGCIDVLAFRRGEPGILGVQATTIDHLSNRLAKARASAELAAWLSIGQRFECWGWHFQEGENRWRVKRVELLAGEVVPRIVAAPVRRRRRADQPGLFDALPV